MGQVTFAGKNQDRKDDNSTKTSSNDHALTALPILLETYMTSSHVRSLKLPPGGEIIRRCFSDPPRRRFLAVAYPATSLVQLPCPRTA